MTENARLLKILYHNFLILIFSQNNFFMTLRTHTKNELKQF